MSARSEVMDALQAHQDHLFELAELARVLDALEGPPFGTYLLARIADRLDESWEAVQALIEGGMGGMPPMGTQQQACPNCQSAAHLAGDQLTPSCPD